MSEMPEVVWLPQWDSSPNIGQGVVKWLRLTQTSAFWENKGCKVICAAVPGVAVVQLCKSAYLQHPSDTLISKVKFKAGSQSNFSGCLLVKVGSAKIISTATKFLSCKIFPEARIKVNPEC